MNASNSSTEYEWDYTTACRNFMVSIHGLVCALVLLCVVGNSMSFCAWRKVGGRRGFSSSIVLLMTLAVSDTLITIVTLLVVTVPQLIFMFTDGYNYYNDVVFAYLGKYIWPVGSTALCVTTWVTTLLSIQRYAILQFPFSLRTKTLVSVKNTVCQIIGIIVVSILFNVTGFFEYDIIVVQDANETRNELTFSKLFLNDIYNIGFAAVTFIIVVIIVPLLTTICLAYKIIRLLVKARSTRGNMATSTSGGNHKELGVSVALVTVIIIFIVCQTPNAVFRIMLAVDPLSSVGCGGKYFHIQLIHILTIVFNSSINFCVYGFCCSEFRTELLEMLRTPCCGLRENHSQQQGTGHTHQTPTSSVTTVSSQLTQEQQTQL